jgi:hypothetical protein
MFSIPKITATLYQNKNQPIVAVKVIQITINKTTYINKH